MEGLVRFWVVEGHQFYEASQTDVGVEVIPCLLIEVEVRVDGSVGEVTGRWW